MKVPTLIATGILCLFAPALAEVEMGADAPEVDAKEYINTEPVTLTQLQGRLIFLELWKTT